jgi:two-component sensor histidine kinase
VASLAELARQHTDLDAAEVGHLQRLLASWGLLADFCFADLLLFAPVRDTKGTEFLVLGQVRPTTSQTVYRRDWVGEVVDETERQVVARSFRLGEIIEGEINIPPLKERVRVLGIPVRHEGEVVAVLTRESTPAFGRQPGELERTYVEVFNRLARMIAAGEFPFAAVDTESEEAPRVGDGVIVLDAQGRVEYTSPNAVSALHRVGVHANTEGMRLGELGLDETAMGTAFAIPAPVTQEIEQGQATVLFQFIPLLDKGAVTGAVLLLRDISELRRRDRLLLSKDATIREIHHRVKNNLQTISSLLSLQARRLGTSEAKTAIEESVRRVRSIALVHETLSREAGEDVPFVDIVKPLVRMVEEGLYSPERPVRFHVTGDAGKLPATVATPLAVVLTELLQNAVDHAYPDASGLGGGRVMVELDNDGVELCVRVVDDGVGLPDGFQVETTRGLGLSIVRTLVNSELSGTITMRTGTGEHGRPGTVVELRVPLTPARAA